MIVKRLLTTALLLTFCLISGRVWAVDGKALLMEMAGKLAQAQQFSVTMHMSYDAVQDSGQKIEFSELRKVIIQRPNNLRVDAQQSDGDQSCLIFDGKTITLFSKKENVYSRTSHPGDVDAAIRYAGGQMGIRIPLARILVTDLPQELKKMVTRVEYVEKNTLGAPLDHIAVRSKKVDLQVWIAEDKLPRRIILTYKNAPGQPQFRAEFTDWNLTPKIPAETFKFTPPQGAEKIPTLLPQSQLQSGKDGKGGAK
jgi:hypothetical protein